MSDTCSSENIHHTCYAFAFIYSGDFDLISGHQTYFYSIMHIYKRKKCLNLNQNKMPMNCTVYTLCPVESVSCPYIEYFSILNGTHTVSFVYKIQIYCQHCIIDVHEWIYVSSEFLYPKNSSCFRDEKNVQPHQSGVKSTLFFILTVRLIRSTAFVGIISSWIVEHAQHPLRFGLQITNYY